MDFGSDGSPLNLDARANPFQPRAVQRSISLPFALSPHLSSTLETPHRLIASEEDIFHVYPRHVSHPVQYCQACASPGSGHEIDHHVVRFRLHSRLCH